MATGGRPAHASSAPDSAQQDEIRAQLARVLATAAFASSPRRSQLFRYLVERTLGGEGQGLTEYAIGVDVFERPVSFDPRIESIVAKRSRPAAPEAEGLLCGARPPGSGPDRASSSRLQTGLHVSPGGGPANSCPSVRRSRGVQAEPAARSVDFGLGGGGRVVDKPLAVSMA